MLFAILSVGALLGVALIACAGGQSRASAKEEGAPELLQRLRAMEAAATCTSAADCRTLPIGARICGGPEAWLAMSAAQMAEAGPLAERLTALRKSANEVAAAKGIASTCQMVPEPAVGCVGGYCRVIPQGPAGRVD
jgi:hypothetical protein